MQNTGYYRILDHSQGNICDLSDSLIVNCTGRTYTHAPFITNEIKGRVDFYLLYITEGHIKVYLDKSEWLIGPGMGIIYYPNNCYHYSFDGTEIISYYWVHFTGKDALPMLQRFNLNNQYLFNIGVQTKVVHLFDKMASEIICRENDFAFSAATYLLQMFVTIKRYISSPKEVLYATRLKKSIEYLHIHYDKDISIEKLAKIENFSESRYRFVFHEITGVSPKKYLTDIRMRHACEFLSQTDLSIGQVGKLVGYDDLLYFYRIFKKYNNITPTQYRSEYKNVLL